MKILWFTWKDRQHPLAGGAEVVNEELAKRLVKDGHEVTLLVGGFPGAEPEEVVDGYKVVRLGNRYTVYWHAFRYYRKHLRGWADLVIDEINTIPFFTKFYVKEPSILLVYMLCREIWFHQMWFPLSLMGYLIEPIYIWLLRSQSVITISESTKQDLIRSGFMAKNIKIMSVGISRKPVLSLKGVKKFTDPTVLSLGSIRPMKNTLDQLKAFELAKQQIPNLKMKVAGELSGGYGRKILKFMQTSHYAADIEYLGRVTLEQKMELMQKSHAILVTSVKEGWGLIVTEAASQGTPAVVYNVDGLRDSVRYGLTGLISQSNTPAGLASSLIGLLGDSRQYDALRKAAWDWSKQITFNNSYKDFKRVVL